MELHSFSELPRLALTTQTAPPVHTQRRCMKALSEGIHGLFSQRELVAGGDVLWRPIDKQSALLLSKRKPTTEQRINNMIKDVKIDLDEAKMNSQRVTDATKITKIGNRLIKESKQVPMDVCEFAQEVERARKILEQSTDCFRGDVLNFMTNDMPQAVEKARQWRMTIERETTMSLRALEDLRKFFLGSDHEKEMLRLSEFVRVCERLAGLAKDGTLDKVADVMLKLA